MSLFRVIIYNYNTIIADLFDDLDQEYVKLDNNLTFILLEAKPSIHYNQPMIAVVVTCMLYFACSERSNLHQMVNGQLSFAHNVPKQYTEIFY